MRAMLTLTLVLLVAVVTAPMAQWAEVGDAGDLCTTGQVPTGAGALTTITGSAGVNGDADLYCVNVASPSAFSATTCYVTSIDTQLWLFDQQCMGLSHNDDDPAGCGLQSTVTGTFLPGPGNFWLGISTYDWDPMDAAGNELWADTPYGDETPPDGPGGGGPVTVWGGTAFADGPYQINLTGAGYCGLTATEETSWSTIKTLY